MSNWVKFSDRFPTENDADPEGEVIVGHPDGTCTTVDVHWARTREHEYSDLCWMENVPPLPEPRTLEDVVNGLLAIDAQLEVLERKDLGMLGEVNSWNPD